MVYEYGDEPNTGEDNVLKYIYMLDKHLSRLKLNWQGLYEDRKNKMHRMDDAIGSDSFINNQINALSVVLAPHNFVSQIKKKEKGEILMDTFTAFLKAIRGEKYFSWDKLDLICESFWNTLHLFLNILEGGMGAQFTIGAQTGITKRIHREEEKEEMPVIMDMPNMFGFGKNKSKPNPQQQEEEEEYEE